MNFPDKGKRTLGLAIALILSVSLVPGSSPALASQGRPSTSITGFALGSSAIPSTAKQKAVRFISNNRNYRTATCIGYADKSGSAAVNQRLAVARANAVCALIQNKGGLTKTKAVGRWNSTESGGAFRRVEIVLSQPKGGGGGGTPACEDIDPWSDFANEHWVLYADPTMYAGDEWLTGTYKSGDWGIVVRQRDYPNDTTWPSELSSACVVNYDLVLEYSPDSGTTWNLFDNAYLQTIKPGGSTETLSYSAFVVNPSRYPSSYFTNSRYHWTVTTDFQTWDYYSYLTDRVPVWIDVEYDAVTPAGAVNVIVQYSVPGGGQATAYVTPGTPLSVTVARGGSIHIVAPTDANVVYTMDETQGSTVTSDGGSTFVVPGFTGWTTTDGTIWSYTVDAESAYNLTSSVAP